MAVPFPYPDNSVNSTIGLLKFANSLTEGFLGTAILIIVGVISFIVTKSFSTDKALGFAAFITMLSAILLRFMNLINDKVMYIAIILFVGVLVWLWFLREQESV